MGAQRVTFEIFFQTILSSLLLASVLALSSFAIVFIFRTSTTTNFAQGLLSVFGAFVTAYLLDLRGAHILVALLAGMATSFIIGLLIDVVIFRRAKRIFPIGKQMITMGILMMLLNLIPVIFGTGTYSISTLLPGNTTFTMFGYEYVITNHALLSTIITTVILTVIFIALKYTKWGLGVRATASNETVAAMMGVNTRFITAATWSLAGGLGALAAVLYGSTVNFSSGIMTQVQINAFLANVFGGFGTFYGPVVGAFIINIGGNLIGYLWSAWREVLVYAFVLVFILIKPYGMFGKKVVKKV
ncbi:MAG TPA: branched-chain amino acid ABC transporter permease [Firmicutes bacterium]|jgi:branched-chain amino acid transport system permease protein|nr:branched-chain amino acid ABC transporter permease [Bacillota bacterium]